MAYRVQTRSPGKTLATLFLAILWVTSSKARPSETDWQVWRSQELKLIAEKMKSATTEDVRDEYQARQKWLANWVPGKMSAVPQESMESTTLTEEPLLSELQRPANVDAASWESMLRMQAELMLLDTAEDRKANLRQIIDLADRLEKQLTAQLPDEAQQLPARSAWTLAFARYRLGRALAYRELPVVRDRWPISDADRYEKRLLTACQKLLDLTERVLPEFILLEDRMLRRAGKKGLALQLLETHQGVIETKWYLKKRRDLLKELGWEPPHKEAARIYYDAGYRDAP